MRFRQKRGTATNILKDGQAVIVDGNHGIVKIV
jgi:hypothetical protein